MSATQIFQKNIPFDYTVGASHCIFAGLSQQEKPRNTEIVCSLLSLDHAHSVASPNNGLDLNAPYQRWHGQIKEHLQESSPSRPTTG